jgi:hypothetical protein
MSSAEKTNPVFAVVHPDKNASAPKTVPPIIMATLDNASRLFIIKYKFNRVNYF